MQWWPITYTLSVLYSICYKCTYNKIANHQGMDGLSSSSSSFSSWRSNGASDAMRSSSTAFALLLLNSLMRDTWRSILNASTGTCKNYKKYWHHRNKRLSIYTYQGSMCFQLWRVWMHFNNSSIVYVRISYLEDQISKVNDEQNNGSCSRDIQNVRSFLCCCFCIDCRSVKCSWQQ